MADSYSKDDPEFMRWLRREARDRHAVHERLLLASILGRGVTLRRAEIERLIDIDDAVTAVVYTAFENRNDP